MSRPSPLKERLEKMAGQMKQMRSSSEWKYGSYEELVLAYGVEMEGIPLSTKLKSGLPKHCYFNCYNLMLKQKNLIYVEGYAFEESIDLPIAHAWLMTPEGKAVDPTWKKPADYYLGIPLSFQWVKTVLNSRKKDGEIRDYSVLTGNYLEKFSLLKQGIPPEAHV